MDQISQESFVRASLEGKVALISNLARYFGKRINPGLRFLWYNKELMIYVNDDKFFTIARYKQKIVCSDVNVSDLIFIDGPWWEIIENLWDEINLKIRQAEIEQINKFKQIPVPTWQERKEVPM